jgi:putative transcriptional regulator
MDEQSERQDAEEPAGEPRFLAGHFLISDINLMDPNFFRSVVLMMSHDEEGAFGLVVNRPSRYTLGDLVDGARDTPAAAVPVYIGGPVQQEILFMLHAEFPGDVSSEGSEHPLEDVVFEPATQPMMDYLKEEWSALDEGERPAVRLYAGYSGWGPGQLESELKADAWVILKATSEIVFHSDPEKGWADALARKGPLYRIILQTGFKPSMN